MGLSLPVRRRSDSQMISAVDKIMPTAITCSNTCTNIITFTIRAHTPFTTQGDEEGKRVRAKGEGEGYGQR